MRLADRLKSTLWTIPVLFALVSCVGGCSQQRPEPELQIVNVLNAQADAWNRGDLEGFMEPYWQSDELTYSGSGQTRDGWTELLGRYKERYPTSERMGRLEFDQLRLRLLGRDAALVIGRWHLQREGDPVGGTFSLVFQRMDNRWVIIHDHTSAAPPTEGSPTAAPE